MIESLVIILFLWEGVRIIRVGVWLKKKNVLSDFDIFKIFFLINE